MSYDITVRRLSACRRSWQFSARGLKSTPRHAAWERGRCRAASDPLCQPGEGWWDWFSMFFLLCFLYIFVYFGFQCKMRGPRRVCWQRHDKTDRSACMRRPADLKRSTILNSDFVFLVLELMGFRNSNSFRLNRSQTPPQAKTIGAKGPCDDPLVMRVSSKSVVHVAFSMQTYNLV